MTCQTCRYCHVMDNRCLKDPPRAFVVPNPQRPQGYEIISAWPPIKLHLGCGAYAPAEEPRK